MPRTTPSTSPRRNFFVTPLPTRSPRVAKQIIEKIEVLAALRQIPPEPPMQG